jgi:hypothetical protein
VIKGMLVDPMCTRAGVADAATNLCCSAGTVCARPPCCLCALLYLYADIDLFVTSVHRCCVHGCFSQLLLHVQLHLQDMSRNSHAVRKGPVCKLQLRLGSLNAPGPTCCGCIGTDCCMQQLDVHRYATHHYAACACDTALSVISVYT